MNIAVYIHGEVKDQPVQMPSFSESGAETVSVYEYYDRELLYSIKDDRGDLYLVMLVDETEEADRSLCVRMSSERMAAAEGGEIELRDVFAKADQGDLFQIFEFHDPCHANSIGRVDPANLADEDLPERGVKLLVKEIDSDADKSTSRLKAEQNRGDEIWESESKRN